jgi:D-aminopeptidase
MHGSGEIVLAFSTANKVPRETRKMVYRMKILLDQRLDPLYEAVIEATEEAILNALCAARDMDGVHGNLSRALPIGVVKEMVGAWQRQVEGRRRAAAAPRRPAPPQTPAAAGEAEKRDGGVAIPAALPPPSAVRGAEGMASPARPPAPQAPPRLEPMEAEPGPGTPPKED